MKWDLKDIKVNVNKDIKVNVNNDLKTRRELVNLPDDDEEDDRFTEAKTESDQLEYFTE